MQEDSLFSTPFPAFIACRLLDRSHSDWCEMVPHSGFDLHFSDNVTPTSYTNSVSQEVDNSAQFSHSVVTDSLRPHGLQHTRPPCPSPIPGANSNPCALSQGCHPTSSSSVVPFSSHLQSFPASSGSFPMSQFFTSGGQSIRVSALVSVLPMNIQD